MTSKIIGFCLFLIGLFALVTPLTPGAWLIPIGLGMMGIKVEFWDKIQDRVISFFKRLRKRDSNTDASIVVNSRVVQSLDAREEARENL